MCGTDIKRVAIFIEKNEFAQNNVICTLTLTMNIKKEILFWPGVPNAVELDAVVSCSLFCDWEALVDAVFECCFKGQTHEMNKNVPWWLSNLVYLFGRYFKFVLWLPYTSWFMKFDTETLSVIFHDVHPPPPPPRRMKEKPRKNPPLK